MSGGPVNVRNSKEEGQVRWCMPTIPATQEAETGGLKFEST
jgi:hypothetical protein